MDSVAPTGPSRVTGGYNEQVLGKEGGMLHDRLRERATGLLAPLGGQIILAGDQIHLPLPGAGRWIELTPVGLVGRGPGWKGADWPSGAETVGTDWEVLTWVLVRLAFVGGPIWT